MSTTIDDSRHNFELIFNAKKGAGYLCVEDANSDSLKLVYKNKSWWGRFTDSLPRLSSRQPTALEKKTDRAVKALLSDLNDHREAFSVGGEPLENQHIRHVVLDRLSEQPQEIFNRHSLFELENLQNALSDKLAAIRARKSEDTDEFRLDQAIAKADLMFRLRIGTKLNKGASSSVLISWFQEPEPFAIFKPEFSSGSWGAEFLRWLQFYSGWQISHLSTGVMARPQAEVAVTIVANLLNLPITCATRITDELGDRKGSIQLFEPGMVEAKEIRAMLDGKTKFDPREILNFQLMVILDYLIGDLDGHDENWLVRVIDHCLIAELKKIDNANSFPITNPGANAGYDCKQYIWKDWNIAAEVFCDEARALMASLTVEKLDEMVAAIKRQLPGFFNSQENMIPLFHQRARILRVLAGLPQATPEQLGNYRSDPQIEQFLRHYEKPYDPAELEQDWVLVEDQFGQSRS